MILLIESLIFCFIFTIIAGGMTYLKPLSMINNYPPAIQEKALELGLITKDQKSKSTKIIIKKIIALFLLVFIIAFIVRKFNNANSFVEGFKYSYILWVIVNFWDALIIDCLWFCHSKRVIIKGTEGMKEYKDYWFHIKGALKGCLYGIPACLLVGLLVMILPNNKSNEVSKNITANRIDTNTTILEKEVSKQNDYNESEYDNKMKKIHITINGKTYDAVLEENDTAQSFANALPKEFQMNELNGNEKYIYLDNTFPTNSYNPKHIEAGDIMLFGNNCLVVFYKSFDTSYSYTKIGHIENLPDLASGNITIKFEE